MSGPGTVRTNLCIDIIKLTKLPTTTTTTKNLTTKTKVEINTKTILIKCSNYFTFCNPKPHSKRRLSIVL